MWTSGARNEDLTRNDGAMRTIGTLGATFSLLAAAAAVALTWSFIEQPSQPDSGGGGFIEIDGRGALLFVLRVVAFLTAAVASVGGRRRAIVGWGCFVVCCALYHVVVHYIKN